MRRNVLRPAAPAPDGPDIGRHELRTDAAARNSILRFVAQVFVASTFAIWAARLAASFAPKLTFSLLIAAACGYGLIALLKALFRDTASGKPFAYAGIMAGGAVCVLAFDLLPPGPLGFMSFGGALFLGAVVATAVVGRAVDQTSEEVNQFVALGYSVAAVLLAVCTVPGNLLFTVRGDFGAATSVVTGATAAASLSLWFLVLDVHAGYVLAHPEHTAQKIQAEREWWRTRRKRLLVGTLSVAGFFVTSGAFEAFNAQGTAARATLSPGAAVNAAGASTASRLLLPGLVGLTACTLFWNGRAVWRGVLVWMLYRGEDAPGIYKPKGWLGSVRLRQALFAAVLVLSVFRARLLYSQMDALIAAYCVTVVRLARCDTGVLLGLLDYAGSFFDPLVIAVFPAAVLAFEFKQVHQRVEETEPDEPYKRKESV